MRIHLLPLHQLIADCDQGHHRYRPTWTVGHLLCTVCGKQGVCPICAPHASHTKQHLALCAKHRPKEERA